MFFKKGTPIFRPRLLLRTFIIHDADIFLHNNQASNTTTSHQEALKMLGHEKYINPKVGLQNVSRIISVPIDHVTKSLGSITSSSFTLQFFCKYPSVAP